MKTEMSGDIVIRHDLRPGDLGRVVTLHGDALPGFGLTFDAFAARTVAEYVLDAGANGRMWLAERDGQLLGCTAIVLRDDARGQLRWVLVDPAARGIGLGKELVHRALAFCRDQALYEALGFQTVSDSPEELWDGVRPLILMELAL